MNAKKILFRLGIFLLSSFVIVYVLIQLISSLSSDVSYEYVSEQDHEASLEKTAYIVRSETILTAENDGILSYIASESQKVGIGQQIANVYSSSQGMSLQNEINEIERKIAVLTRSAIGNSYLTSDVNKIDQKIYENIIKARSSVESNDLSLVSDSKEEVLINMNKRQLVTSGKDNFSEQIEALNQKKESLTATLQSALSSVYAPQTGYFSTLLDGYETIFTKDKIKNLTLSSFDELVSAEKVKYSNTTIGKIITDFDWYTICEVTATEADAFQIGRAYPVTYLYSSGQQLSAVLEKKITQTDSNRAILVFLMEEVPNDFDYSRKQTIKLITDKKSGISFPASALRIVDGVQGVYIVAGNVVDFKKVEIIDSTQSKFFSKEFDKTEENADQYLSRFDRVITEGKNLYVGKILN